MSLARIARCESSWASIVQLSRLKDFSCLSRSNSDDEIKDELCLMNRELKREKSSRRICSQWCFENDEIFLDELEMKSFIKIFDKSSLSITRFSFHCSSLDVDESENIVEDDDDKDEERDDFDHEESRRMWVIRERNSNAAIAKNANRERIKERDVCYEIERHIHCKNEFDNITSYEFLARNFESENARQAFFHWVFVSRSSRTISEWRDEMMKEKDVEFFESRDAFFLDASASIE